MLFVITNIFWILHQSASSGALSLPAKNPYKATSINRTLATIRHAGRWLNNQRPLIAGDPLAQVKDVQVDSPDWNGLTSRQLMRLKAACEQRIKSCDRKNQNPLLETAVFYTLLGTGLHESELVTLNRNSILKKDCIMSFAINQKE